MLQIKAGLAIRDARLDDNLCVWTVCCCRVQKQLLLHGNALLPVCSKYMQIVSTSCVLLLLG